MESKKKPIFTEAKDHIIVALDVPSLEEAKIIVQELSGSVGAFKVGLELLTSEGSRSVVQTIHHMGARVFYDGKFNDIPNTVTGAVRAIADLGIWMFNVHAAAGPDALTAAVAHKKSSLVIAVTVLTSLNSTVCENIFGESPRSKVMAFAHMARQAGADGIVCSPLELADLQSDPVTQPLVTVVPGIRPSWAVASDQARVMTPGEAIAAGASYVVIGRPILKPPSAIGSSSKAVALITEEIREAIKKRIADGPTEVQYAPGRRNQNPQGS